MMTFHFIYIVILIIILFYILYKHYKQNLKKSYLDNDKNHLHNYFSQIYVITIPDRKEYIKAILKQIKINPIIFNAILKKDIKKHKLIQSKILRPKNRVNKGKIACHLSHLTVLKKFFNSKNNNCFIFEDDLQNPVISLLDMNKYIDHIMLNVPKDYDIIYFGRCWDHCHLDTKITNNLVRSFKPRCRHAYGVSRKGASKIIKYSLPMKHKGGDDIIAKYIKKGNIISYAVTPPLFYQNRSQLGTNLGNYNELPECFPIKKYHS